jgi:hypothetical protein
MEQVSHQQIAEECIALMEQRGVSHLEMLGIIEFMREIAGDAIRHRLEVARREREAKMNSATP